MNQKESYNKQYKNWTFENQSYTKISKKEKCVLNELLKKADMLRGGGTVLDIGCGLGWKSYLLSDMGFKVTGVDISDVAIDKAKRLWKTDIDFRVCDMSYKNTLEEKYDIIFASSFSLFKYDFRKGNYLYGDIVFSYLKEGGILIFDWGANSKWKETHNDWAYISFRNAKEYFLHFGEVIGIWASYRELFPLLGSFSLSQAVTSLVLIASNFHKIGYRLYCIIKV